MIQKLIRCVVAVLVLWLVWWGLGLALSAMHAPPIVGVVVLVLLILTAAWFLATEFGVLKLVPLVGLAVLQSCAQPELPDEPDNFQIQLENTMLRNLRTK